MIDELFGGIESVWSPDYILVTIAGGVIGGIMAAFFAPNHTLKATSWYVVHLTFMLNALLMLYWVGRITVAIVSHDPLWGRIVGGWMLMLLFAFCAGLGISLGLRMRDRWRNLR